jgi:hypothetical protein
MRRATALAQSGQSQVRRFRGVFGALVEIRSVECLAPILLLGS